METSINSEYRYSALSFGAGVQSTALLLLIKYDPQLLLETVGHLPDKAYFADTGAEPQIVYDHLKKMQPQSPIPLEIVSNGSLLSSEIRNGINPRSFPPYFTKNTDGTVGMLMRKCTSEFKIAPVEQAIRCDIGLIPRQRGKNRSVALWLGISIDEITRMRDNPTKLMQNIYPLIELRWDRSKCIEYCRSHGINPPKSKCFFCPYTSDWGDMRRNQPEEFARAVQFDREIRSVVKKGVKGEVFLHRSCQPLNQAVANQGHLWEKSPWEDDFVGECSGTCGT